MGCCLRLSLIILLTFSCTALSAGDKKSKKRRVWETSSPACTKDLGGHPKWLGRVNNCWFYIGVGLLAWVGYDLYRGPTVLWGVIYQAQDPVQYWSVLGLWWE